MSISREKMLSTRLLTACGVFPKASEWWNINGEFSRINEANCLHLPHVVQQLNLCFVNCCQLFIGKKQQPISMIG
jgi:hypothetical protein